MARKRLITIMLLCCAWVLLSSATQAFSETGQTSSQVYVSSQDMQVYAQNVIDECNKTITQYFPDMKSSFYFYSNGYNIKSYLSSQYGGALWFEKANISSFEHNNISEPVETTLFGGNFSKGTLMAIGGAVMFRSPTFKTYDGAVVRLLNNSNIIFINATVIRGNFLGHCTCVIMKGNNETSSWTLEKAKEDAGEILYSDMHIEFSTSEAVKKRYAEPELTNLLQNILQKFGDTSQTYPLAEWNADIQNLEYIARWKYHIESPTGFINDLITYLNARTAGTMPTLTPEPTATPTPTTTPTPTPSPTPSPMPTTTTNQSDNWGYAIFCGFYPIIVFSVYSVVRRKIDDEDWKFFGNDQLIQGGLIGVGYAILAVNFPYNSPHVLYEILLALLIAVCGSAIAIWIKKRFLTLRPSRVNATKRSNKKPSKKQDQTPKANKKVS